MASRSLSQLGLQYQQGRSWRPVPSSRRIIGTGHAGQALLSQATLWLDARLSGRDASNKLVNLGTGGSVLNAQFGSTGTSDTNDPLLLAHTGVNYLYLPGTTTNSASTPDAAALRVTGDIEIVVRCSADDWTPATNMAMVGKENSGALQRGYGLIVNVAGTISMRYSPDGTTLNVLTSSVAAPFTDGTTYWIKATRNATTGQGFFYYAADQATEPTSWTQLGSVFGGSSGSIFAATSTLFVGQVDNALGWAGNMYRAIVRNGIGGTTVFDADFTQKITSGGQTSFTESSSNAATVTINRATSGGKAVAVVRPVLLFRTDDYLEVADSPLLDFDTPDSLTALVVLRAFATPSNFGNWLSKRAVSGAGYLIASNGTTFSAFAQIEGAAVDTTNRTSSLGTLGNATVFGLVRDVAGDTLAAYVNGTPSATITDPTTTSLANAMPLRIGSRADAVTGTQDFEFLAAAVFRRALSAADIATIVSYYGAS